MGTLAKPFEMKELDEMYVGDELLADDEPLGDSFQSSVKNIGKILTIMNGDKNCFKILVREYGQLNDIAVKSVVNIANKLRPNGYESFADSFTNFETSETAAYTVNTAPEDEEIIDAFGKKEEGYSYGIIVFGKEE